MRGRPEPEEATAWKRNSTHWPDATTPSSVHQRPSPPPPGVEAAERIDALRATRPKPCEADAWERNEGEREAHDSATIGRQLAHPTSWMVVHSPTFNLVVHFPTFTCWKSGGGPRVTETAAPAADLASHVAMDTAPWTIIALI